MPEAALLMRIRAIRTDSPFHGEGHRKVWARLRLEGVRTSKRRVLRLMRAHDLLAPTRVGTPRGPRNHDGTIIPDRVDTMWGTDSRS
jgi:putative transposase